MRVVDKPWGHEEIWAQTDNYVGKILCIRHGHRLSLQYHNIKEETVRVLQGVLTLVLGDQTLVLSEGQSAHIPTGMVHRMEANAGDVQVVEVSTPYLDDVVRVQDDYQRI
jgi:mannose-6-phosphate isomerase-like protein (cupin superfamily)